MEDKNFTIIEDIFDTDTPNNRSSHDLNEDGEMSQFFNRKNDTSFLRTLDNNSARSPYPMSSIPSLSYDEDMIKNKLSRQINPRSLASQYNSMNTSNRILQPPPSNLKLNELPKSNMQVRPVMPPPHDNSMYHITCRNIYDHVENCPFCQKYYKQSNRTYILIIVFLVLIILLLLRQNNN